jgi:hypothetical protein
VACTEIPVSRGGEREIVAGEEGRGIIRIAESVPKEILIFGTDSFLTVVSGGAGRVTSEVGIKRLLAVRDDLGNIQRIKEKIGYMGEARNVLSPDLSVPLSDGHIPGRPVGNNENRRPDRRETVTSPLGLVAGGVQSRMMTVESLSGRV